MDGRKEGKGGVAEGGKVCPPLLPRARPQTRWGAPTFVGAAFSRGGCCFGSGEAHLDGGLFQLLLIQRVALPVADLKN